MFNIIHILQFLLSRQIEQIWNNGTGQLPIVVGGTHHYIESLLWIDSLQQLQQTHLSHANSHETFREENNSVSQENMMQGVHL
jgi:tRNA A37 N6-isopentenylltransferase MiaA